MPWQYFNESELACSHCGACHMDSAFMEVLDQLRHAWGKPLVVTSGYRCPQHPIEAKKRSPGAHSTGKAVDLKIPPGGSEGYELLNLVMTMGFTGVGVNAKGGGRFIHVDTCTEEADLIPRPRVWSY